MGNKPISLGDCFTMQRGTTYKSRLLGLPGPVLLGLGSICRNGGFRADSLKTYGGECPEKLMVYPGDLFLSLKDVTQSADLLGAVARLPINQKPGRLTQDTVKLIPIQSEIPQHYLYWLLQTPQYRDYCRQHSTGTTNLGLSRDDFFAFPVLPITTYRLSVCDCLDALEQKITLLHSMNETIEAMARALFKSWFVDFDPVRKKAEGQPTGLPPEIDALFPDSFEDSEQGEIPKDWKIKELTEEFEITMGQSPPGESYNEFGEGIPFYQGRTDFGFRYPTRRLFCTDPKRFASVGDTLVSVRAPVGDMNMAYEKCCIGRGVASVRHKESYLSFTYYCLNSLRESFYKFEAEGTVFGSINQKDFHRIKCAMAPRELIRVLDRLILPIDQEILSQSREISLLENTRDSLLPKLISGDLELSDQMIKKILEPVKCTTD